MATEWISRDSIVAALDMCAVLAHYDIKSGRGTSFRIHCPFHEDDRPSCSINPASKVFNCFGCGENGNVLDFIAGMEDLDPKAEFRAVLEKAIEIIGHNPTPQRTRSRRDRSTQSGNTKSGSTHSGSKSKAAKQNGDGGSELSTEPGSDAEGIADNHNDAVTDTSKKHSQKASESFRPAKRTKSRKAQKVSVFSSEPDGSLQLEPNRVLEGPAFPLKLDESHPWLDAQLTRIGIKRSVAAEFGIGFEGRSNALMANRVCFPIHNGEGGLVAYAGRWASDDTDDQGRFFTDNGREQPRYRLPKGFRKQLELFNWHRIIEQFDDVSTIVLVEGFWSVLRLQAMTIPSVALMGLSISDAQIRLLLDGGIRSVIVMLDGDDEGRAAMETLAARLSSHFFIRCVVLPQGSKPDDVDLSVLNEVKALCADTEFRTESAQRVNAEQRKKALAKTTAKTTAQTVTKTVAKASTKTQKKPAKKLKGKDQRKGSDTATEAIDQPNEQVAKQGSKAKPKAANDYVLPSASATASFGWTNVN